VRGRHVFGMVAFVFHVKREEEEGGAGRSSVKKVRRYEIVSLLTYHSLKI
jgi:hypothetical protein